MYAILPTSLSWRAGLLLAGVVLIASPTLAQSPDGPPVVAMPVVPAVPDAPPGAALPVVVPAAPDASLPAAVPPLATAPTVPPAEKPKWEFRWGDPGLYLQTTNKDFVAHVGATVHYDAAWYQASPLLQFAPGGTGQFVDGVNFRRGRIFLEGTLYQAVDYKFELEFANGILGAGTGSAAGVVNVSNSPGPTDAWITIKDVPWLGNVRIGSQKEWFSLEHLNNYRALEFMERSYLFDFAQPTAFNNGFSPGISTFRTHLDDRIFTAIGAYKNESDLIGVGLGFGQYAVTGRVALLPIWEPDSHMWWHIGGAMSHRDPVNGSVQIRIRDNVRNAPFPLLNLIANTGQIPTGSQDLYNLETAAVFGPLTFQAEYTANVLNGASLGGRPGETLFFQGYYAEAMWLITGESRTFNNKQFVLNRVLPKHPVRFKPSDDGCGRGTGAWELAVRYTYLDLSNRNVQAGRLDAVTLGVNWYLNAGAKLQFNYDYAHRGDLATPAQGNVHAFGTRMALDF